MIYCLIYVSASTHLMSQEELEEILAVARKNNEALDITGMLLYSDGSFFQILEGPKDEVKRLFYEKIGRDERHVQVIKMLETEVEERSFPDWRMGFKSISQSEANQIPGFIQYRNGDYGAVSDLAVNNPKAYKLLEVFKGYNKG